ncbi:MAG: redoxin domain-containing protein [Planctomycetota bacterium]|nr:redoxin domain-containing protein [Planctomycetota bacterium]
MRLPDLLLPLALTVAAAAQTSIPATPLQKVGEAKSEPANPANPLDALKLEWDVVSKLTGQPGSDAQSLEARRAAVVRQAQALMAEDPRGEIAVRTRIWAALAGVEAAKADQLLDELTTKDLASPALVDLADQLRPGSRPRARSVLSTLSEKAGDRSVRGRSLRALADHVKSDLELVRAVGAGDVPPDSLQRANGLERAAELQKLGIAGLQAQYEGMLERVSKEYGDVLDSRGRAIGPRAEGVLFEMRNLVVGKLAPDIVAEDVDGASFKLSDYRGKVVLLDFWGHW